VTVAAYQCGLLSLSTDTVYSLYSLLSLYSYGFDNMLVSLTVRWAERLKLSCGEEGRGGKDAGCIAATITLLLLLLRYSSSKMAGVPE